MFSAFNPLCTGIVYKRSSFCIRCFHATRPVVLGKQITKQEVNNNDPATSVFPVGLTDVKVNNLERWVLVWAGKYKKYADVPRFVNKTVLDRARNKARVKISLYMIALTAIGCGMAIVSGKRAALRGESVVKMNEDFHKEYNKEPAKEST